MITWKSKPKLFRFTLIEICSSGCISIQKMKVKRIKFVISKEPCVCLHLACPNVSCLHGFPYFRHMLSLYFYVKICILCRTRLVKTQYHFSDLKY